MNEQEKIDGSVWSEELSAKIESMIEVEEAPPKYEGRRGRPSPLGKLYEMKPGQALVCPPGWPKAPHQTVYYHNKRAASLGLPHKWVAGCKAGVWRIYRTE
jgi:hypothetical protein